MMRAVSVHTATLAVVTVFTTACSDPPTRPTNTTALDTEPSSVRAHDRLKDWLSRFLNRGGAPTVPILVGAGDIAECYQGTTPPPFNPTTDAKHSAAEQTARLLDRIPGTVIAVGDNAYQFGSTFDYEACYDPTWGRHFERTRPAAGNHEYMTPGALGYFAYFGERAVPPPDPSDPNPPGNGYYSYNVGSWHVIVLNSTPQVYLCWAPETSEVPPEYRPPLPAPANPEVIGETCPGDPPQWGWLANDLARHINTLCTIVYFHHPRFSSGHHGNHFQMQRIWRMLYQAGADVVVAGHDHNYERFAPQNADGEADPIFGMRQFVVGTGGADLRSVGDPIENSERIISGRHGVITLALRQGGYDWAFVDVKRSVLDSGTGACHEAPPPA
jgi:hypothetical protein